MMLWRRRYRGIRRFLGYFNLSSTVTVGPASREHCRHRPLFYRHPYAGAFSLFPPRDVRAELSSMYLFTQALQSISDTTLSTPWFFAGRASNGCIQLQLCRGPGVLSRGPSYHYSQRFACRQTPENCRSSLVLYCTEQQYRDISSVLYLKPDITVYSKMAAAWVSTATFSVLPRH